MYSNDGMTYPHDHHIVRENAPSNWTKEYQEYITKSQQIIKDAGIDINKDIRNFTVAENGNGAHTQMAAKHVYEELIKSKNIDETMNKLAKEMNSGKFF
jgi:hypothetical protein